MVLCIRRATFSTILGHLLVIGLVSGLNLGCSEAVGDEYNAMARQKAEEQERARSDVLAMESEPNVLEDWRVCPTDRPAMTIKLERLGQISQRLNLMDADEKLRIAYDTTWQSSLVLHLAPWILPPDLLTEIAHTCWERFATVSRAIVDQSTSQRSGASYQTMRDWDTCLLHNWQESYTEKAAHHLAPLMRCLFDFTRPEPAP